MGTKGANEKSFAFYEELPFRATPNSNNVAIYKRHHLQKKLPLEQRNYFVHIPVENTNGGIRKSLRTINREDAIKKAEDLLLEVKVDIRQGSSIVPVPVEVVVDKFLEFKKSFVRDEWDSKKDKGRRSITKARYILISGKLRNYFVRFLGRKTDIKGVSLKRFNTWEMWRKTNLTRKDMGTPKAITIQNEMGLIRECWKWGMEEGYIPFTPKMPFHNENLITDDRVIRDTWESHEWNSFKGKVVYWLKEQEGKSEEQYWDSYVAYQMLFFLANNGCRSGEVVKLKRKDIRFYVIENSRTDWQNGELGCLIDIHPSTKTGEREVNALCGIFAKRVMDKSKFKSKDDFIFCHLDGSPFTTKQFRTQFESMTLYSNEDERWGKHFVPYSIRSFYATTRLQNGTSTYALCKNMGMTEPYLRKHYSKYMNRLATDELLKVNRNLGIKGKVFDGDDFIIKDVELEGS